MKHFIRQGDTVLDIGANIGFHARLLGELVGSTGSVFAFEPSAENYRRLVHTCRKRPQIIPVQAAASDQNGYLQLWEASHLNVDHRMYPTDSHQPSQPVKALRLDDYVPDAERVTFIKLDVQGYEVQVIMGMLRILSKASRLVMICEYWPSSLRTAGYDTKALLGLFDQQGMGVKVIWRKDMHITDEVYLSNLNLADDSAYCNLLVFAPSMKQEVESLFG